MTIRSRLSSTAVFAAAIGMISLNPIVTASAFAAEPAKRACAPNATLGVSRVVEIDATNGPLYGEISKFPREKDLLQPGEVVLTFDDGPMPWITRAIMDALDAHCTRATFFSVGRMALAYPESVKDILARGHTLGTHTWSHPLNLRGLSQESARNEIERGFAAVAAAAGQPIAPFFRFPGLSDSGPLLTYLQGRNVATFTVDVVSNDSYIRDENRILRETLAKAESQKGGILLFHDIKAATAKMLPGLLDELKRRGFKVVHIVSKKPFAPDPGLYAQMGQQLARTDGSRRAPPSLFAAAKAHAGLPATPLAEVGVGENAAADRVRRDIPAGVAVTALAPAARAFDEAPRRERAEKVSRTETGPRRPIARGATASRANSSSWNSRSPGRAGLTTDAPQSAWATSVKRTP